MPISPRPSPPARHLAPPADANTLVAAGLLPEQPVPSPDPPATDVPGLVAPD